jgi:hypothetical protein
VIHLSVNRIESDRLSVIAISQRLNERQAPIAEIDGEECFWIYSPTSSFLAIANNRVQDASIGECQTGNRLPRVTD